MEDEVVKLLRKQISVLAEIFKVHKAVLQGGKLDHNMVTRTTRLIDDAMTDTAAYLNKVNPHPHTEPSKETLKEEDKLDFCELFPTIKCGIDDIPENLVNPDKDDFL